MSDATPGKNAPKANSAEAHGAEDALEYLLKYAGLVAAPLESGSPVFREWRYTRYDAAEGGFIFTNGDSEDKIILVVNPGDGKAPRGGAQGTFEIVYRKDGFHAPGAASGEMGAKLAAFEFISNLFGKLVTNTPAEILNRFFWLRDLLSLEAINTNTRMASSGVIVRLSGQCNQNCGFCPILDNNTIRLYEREQVMFTLKYLQWRGLERVIFSGGEPTLDPHLEEYVKTASAGGRRWVEIQTNAVRLADADYAAALKNAGLSSAMISLHSHVESVSDEITGAPGTFEKTLMGIRNSMRNNLAIDINCVICEANYRRLREYLEFVRGNLPRLPELMTLSFAAPAFDGWENKGIIPRISDVAQYLFEALQFAEEIGLPTRVPSVCGVPYCMMGEYRRFHEEHNIPAPFVCGDKEKPGSCLPCRHFGRCSGIWKNYIALYGADEFVPIMD